MNTIAIIIGEMRILSSSTIYTKGLGSLRPLIFFITLSLTTAVTFHALAETQTTPVPPATQSNEPDPNDIHDRDLPDWCPPSNDPGLAVICGTAVSSSIQEVSPGTQQPNAPQDRIVVAAYEDNLISPTGKLSGGLTNIFSSTRTNKLGRYRIAVRRVKPPRLKIHLVFFCGAAKAQELIVDSWHNTWGLVTQIDCAQRQSKDSAKIPDTTPPNPPFPLLASASASSFLGCTNEHITDIPIGLSKREEPTINTIVSEDNYDHRFNLNTVTFKSQVTFFSDFQFASPGGLWEPDCLLRNKEGTYQCNALLCRSWEKNNKYKNGDNIKQPCTAEGVKNCGRENSQPCKDANIACGITPGYTGAKVYATKNCTPDPNNIVPETGELNSAGQAALDACKDENRDALEKYLADHDDKLPSDPIDGVLCDAVSGQHGDVGVGMAKDDYVTRPFFKYIPKGPVEYDSPFRRLENRNNLQNFAVDPLTPMQWIATYVGSAAGGNSVPLASFRDFTGAVSTKPGVPNCSALYQRNMPFQDKGVTITQNRLVNNGYITALAEPYSTYDATYYSGQKDLSAYVCQKNSGELVRICEIQVPWGEGALCDITKPGCKDSDLKSNLKKSLNKVSAETSLIDKNQQAEVTNNINNMLNLCGKDFKLGKLYFPQDLIFKAGNNQMGLKSDTPNDSIPAYAQRRTAFMPTATEQEAEAETGSRIIFQGGGKFMANSFNTIYCALNPKECNNNKKAGSLTDILTLPYTESLADVKKRYLDSTTWKVDSMGPGQSSLCSVSNVYNIDIKGPIEEVAGAPALTATATSPKKILSQGGFFDQLFVKNSQHKDELSAGSSTWYMSDNAILRDKLTMTGQGMAALAEGLSSQFWGEEGNRRVGVQITQQGALLGLVNSALGDGNVIDIAFASLVGRDVWDALLTLGGGDATLHNMDFGGLYDIGDEIWGSLSGAVPWKSFASRTARAGGSTVKPAAKPYYSVTFEYPLTETSFKDKFRLPGLNEATGTTTEYQGSTLVTTNNPSTYTETELLPEEWGPGHVCYGFDTPVQQGQICGTYREAPEGVSRTCRVDKCVAFTRVETATCTCTRQIINVGSTGRVQYGPPSKAKCKISNREDRNLIIRDCTRDDRLKCAVLQETSRAFGVCPEGYEKKRIAGPNEKKRCSETDSSGNCYINSCYYQDKRNGKDTSGEILPPDDIDITLDANDQQDHFQGYQDPPLIPETPETCDPSMFDWSENDKSKSRGLRGTESNVRPRCWVSTAGPFRKYPNFGTVGSSVPVMPNAATGQLIKNCNGFIRIEDAALRAKQDAPYAKDVDIKQKQTNLDEGTIVGIKIMKSFTPPYAPMWGGSRMALVDSQETNNGIVADQGLAPDFYTRGQTIDMGGVGDVSTIRNYFTTPVLTPISGKEGDLRPMFYHCDYASTHTLDTKNKKQKEFFSMMSGYDPDLDGIGGWKCPVVPPPDPQLPDIQDKGGSCSVGSWGKCEQLFRNFWGNSVMSDENLTEDEKIKKMNAIGSWHFSRAFQATINWAAYQSNTPGPALMTVLFLEGGMDMQYMDLWGDQADTYNAGIPWFGQLHVGGPISCNDLVWSAQGPFQLIKHWVQCLVDPESKVCGGANKEISIRFQSSLNKAGKGRPESVLNSGRCNFLDAAMIAAFLMNPQAGLHPGQCGGFDLDTALQLFSGGSYAIEGGQGLSDVAQQVYTTCKP